MYNKFLQEENKLDKKVSGHNFFERNAIDALIKESLAMESEKLRKA
jgi:hypothetical protein